MKATYRQIRHGFTIVELLVVIIVIGTLAAITIVSYTGISQKAKIASLQYDLSGAARQLKLFKVADSNENYPASINDCPIPASSNICLKASPSNSYASYVVNNASTPKSFKLVENSGSLSYFVSESAQPSVSVVSGCYVADLTGAQVATPTGSTGIGHADFTLSADETNLHFSLNFSGLGGVTTAGHIFKGAVGAAGSLVNLPANWQSPTWLGFPLSVNSGSVTVDWAITTASVTDIKAGLLYINIHTSTFAGGEIRGQIYPCS